MAPSLRSSAVVLVSIASSVSIGGQRQSFALAFGAEPTTDLTRGIGSLLSVACLLRVLTASTLLNGVLTAALTHRLLDDLQALGLLENGARIGTRGFLRHGVFNLHDAVVQLRTVVLLDGGRSCGGLHVDQRRGAEVLSVHVLVKASADEGAAFREEFLERKTWLEHLKPVLQSLAYLEVRDSDGVRVDVAHFELARTEGSLGHDKRRNWLRDSVLLPLRSVLDDRLHFLYEIILVSPWSH